MDQALADFGEKLNDVDKTAKVYYYYYTIYTIYTIRR